MSDNKKLSLKDKIRGLFSRVVKLKRSGFLKHGSYSFVLTVITLAVIILFNFSLSTLAKKVPLEYDMTAKKVNSISKENSDYIKALSDDITITVCGLKSDYTLYLLSNCEELYNTYANEKLFDLTLSLLEKYNNLSDKITLKFIDTQSADFTGLTQAYPNEKIAIGDIFVSSPLGSNTRFKHLTFYDIYTLMDTTGYASYGYALYSINGNGLETALTSAINFVVNKDVKHALLYKGHSTSDYTSAITTLLKNNNYETEISSEQLLTDIPDTFDSVIILAPSRDFMQNEIDALTAFLEGGGNLGKGIVFIGDALNPELPTLYGFLAEWGIDIKSGVLKETNTEAQPSAEQPTALISFPTGNSDITKGFNAFVTGYNLPMKTGEPLVKNVTATSAATTLSSVFAAPNSEEGGSNPAESDLKNYDTIIEAVQSEGENKSFIYALSSIEFISSDWAENANVSNKDVVLSLTDRASGKTDTAITFVDKAILTEGYTDDITVSKVQNLRRFLLIIPIVLIACGIVVFIRRRNAK